MPKDNTLEERLESAFLAFGATGRADSSQLAKIAISVLEEQKPKIVAQLSQFVDIATVILRAVEMREASWLALPPPLIGRYTITIEDCIKSCTDSLHLQCLASLLLFDALWNDSQAWATLVLTDAAAQPKPLEG